MLNAFCFGENENIKNKIKKKNFLIAEMFPICKVI